MPSATFRLARPCVAILLMLAATAEGQLLHPWQSAPALPEPLARLDVARDLAGVLYVPGGRSAGGATDSVVAFDEVTGTWSMRAPLAIARHSHAVVADSLGRIYAMGGRAAGQDLVTAERYDPQTDQWTFIAPLPQSRRNAEAVASADGSSLFLIGGQTSAGQSSSSVFRYDVAGDQWFTEPPMSHVRAGFGATRDPHGAIYAIGGGAGAAAGSVERRDPATGQWSNVAPLAFHAGEVGAAVTDPAGFIYALGGRDGGGGPASAAVERYDPQADQWMAATSLPGARRRLAASVSRTGRIHVLGGDTGPGNQPTADAFRASPGYCDPAGGCPVVMAPADQVIVPGEPLRFHVFGPPGAPFALAADLAPDTLPTPFGVLGLARTPALVILDGIGGIPGAFPSPGLQVPSSGFFPLVSAPVPVAAIGAEFYFQVLMFDPSFQNLFALSVNGAEAGPAASCRAAVGLCPFPEGPSSIDVTLTGFDVADVNQVDASYALPPGFTEDLEPSSTFHDLDSPGGLVRVTNDDTATHRVRMRYELRRGADQTCAPLEATDGRIVAVAGGATASFADRSLVFPLFPDLEPHPPGDYSMTAWLRVEDPPGSGDFVATGESITRQIRVTTNRPLLLIHGLFGGPGSFSGLAELLEGSPSHPIPVRRFLYETGDGTTPGLDSVDGKSAEFAAFVDATGYTSYDLVGHSAGGLIARRHLADHPAAAAGAKLITGGTPHFGAAFALSVPFSDVQVDLATGSTFNESLTADWPAVADDVFVLSLVGTCQGEVSDGVVRVDEASLPPFTPPGPSTPLHVLNLYLAEKHSTALSGCGPDALLDFDPASAESRPGYVALRELLTSAGTDPLGDVAAQAAPMHLSPPAAAMATGVLLIPFDPAMTPVQGPSVPEPGQAGTIYVNPETSTLVWVSAPVSFTATFCTIGTPLPVCPGLEVLLDASAGLVRPAGFRVCRSLTLAGGQEALQADASSYPF